VSDVATPPGATPRSHGGRLLSGPPAYRPATPWRPGLAVLATAGIVAAALAAATVIAVLLGGAPPGPARPTAGDMANRLWALAALQAVAVALTLLAGTLFGGRVRDVMALRAAPAGWRANAGAILAMVAFQVVLAAVQHFLLRHDLLTDLRPFVGLITGPQWPLAAAVLAIGAPLSEELLFRGFLLSALARSRLGFAGAALIASAAWTTLHAGYSLVGLAEVFAIGLLLSWVLWRTGSLWVTIFCHAAYNGAIVLALLLVGWPV
jgi:membrane protease YdiL (CAAX protease family)